MKLIVKIFIVAVFITGCKLSHENKITCHKSSNDEKIRNVKCQCNQQIWRVRENKPNSKVIVNIESTVFSREDYWNKFASKKDYYRNYEEFLDLNPYLESYILSVTIQDDSLAARKEDEINIAIKDSTQSTMANFYDKEVSSHFSLEIRQHFIKDILKANSISLIIGNARMEFSEEFRNTFKKLILRTRNESTLL